VIRFALRAARVSVAPRPHRSALAAVPERVLGPRLHRRRDGAGRGGRRDRHRESSLGQGVGHSLVGLFALDLPIGLGLTLGSRRLLRGWRPWPWLVRGIAPGPPPSLAIQAWSIWIGALSHLVFDFVSHGNFLWFYPWYDDPEFFPDFWYARWFEVAVPGYEAPYPIGPHFVVWVILSALGAVLYFVRPKPAREP
jgi:hypothetical protein